MGPREEVAGIRPRSGALREKQSPAQARKLVVVVVGGGWQGSRLRSPKDRGIKSLLPPPGHGMSPRAVCLLPRQSSRTGAVERVSPSDYCHTISRKIKGTLKGLSQIHLQNQQNLANMISSSRSPCPPSSPPSC